MEVSASIVSNPIGLHRELVWGKYLGRSDQKGVEVARRAGPTDTKFLPATRKSAAKDMNSQSSRWNDHKRLRRGIAREAQGMLAKERRNMFMVRDGQIFTPPLSSAILAGITRDSVIQIARSRYEVKRRSYHVPDSMLQMRFSSPVLLRVKITLAASKRSRSAWRRGPMRHPQKEFFADTSGEKKPPANG